jgi:hypothetical protein
MKFKELILYFFFFFFNIWTAVKFVIKNYRGRKIKEDAFTKYIIEHRDFDRTYFPSFFVSYAI